MSRLFTLPGAVRNDPRVDAWFETDGEPLRHFARSWFDRMRACGPDVCELLHDGHPTACVEEVAFGYVNVFSAHVNVGFFHGSALDDATGLLEGSGKHMRHVKLRWGQPVDTAALNGLIKAAYRDIRLRLGCAA